MASAHFAAKISFDERAAGFDIARVLRRIITGIVCLLIAGLMAAIWYAYNKGFTHKWRQFVVLEFRKRGVELTMRQLALEPFRGIVARDVKVYEDRNRKRTRAVIDEVRLVINYANLFKGGMFVDALDLHDARIDVPLDPKKPGGTKFKIDRLSGRLFLPPQQLYLSHLEAELYGVRVTASGRVINPKRMKTKRGGMDTAELGKRIIEELKALKFEGGAPQLDVRFSGDLTELDKVFVEATLWGEKVRRGGYLVESFHLNAGFRDGVFSLKQCTATDARGTLRAGGSFDTASREATLQLHSGLDAQGFIRAFEDVPELQDTVFYAPPSISATMRATFGDALSFQVLGTVALKKFAYKTEVFDGFNADFSWDGTRWAARDVRLAHRTGAITGDVMQLPDDFRQRLRSTMDAKVLPPLLTGRAAEWFGRLKFTPAESPDLAGKPR